MTITPLPNSHAVVAGTQIDTLIHDIQTNNRFIHIVGNIVYCAQNIHGQIVYYPPDEVQEPNLQYCKLEFFYYYRPNGNYRTGVWVRINDYNNKWLYIHQSPFQARKVCIATDYNMGIHGFIQTLRSYQLPSTANLANGFSGNNIYLEKKIANNQVNIFTELELRLPHICI